MSEEKKNEVANKQPTLVEMIQGDSMKKQWALVLPKTLTADRMARVAITQLRKTPKLAQCTQPSLFGALMTCAELGIEPDGRRAHLIPYGKECQLIIDYKGLAELAMRSGKISNIHADVVCENDVFEYDCGEIKKHSINFKDGRGDMYAAYARVTFKDGTTKCEVMGKSEVEGIRNRSRAGKSGPWVSDYNEMAKKTAFRRLSKWLPLSPDVFDALDKDADQTNFSVDAGAAPYAGEVNALTKPVVEEPEEPEAVEAEVVEEA